MQILTALLFALLATLIPSDIPIRFEILGPSATLTNTEQMFDAMPAESPVAAQERPQDVYNYHVYLPIGSKPIPVERITPQQIRNATGLLVQSLRVYGFYGLGMAMQGGMMP